MPGCQEALQCYDEGITARQQSDWEKARVLLLKSWNLQRHFQTAANLGEMELKVGQHREAAEHLAYFLEEAPPSVPDADRTRGKAMLDQARASLGTLRVARPPGAEVYVDGQKIEDVSPNHLILVEPGRRRVEARRPGYPSIAETREVRAGSVVEVSLTAPSMIERPHDDRGGGARRWVIVTGATATGLGAAMGAGFAILSEVKRHDRDATPCYRYAADCGPKNALERARGGFLTASLVSFLAAGAIGSGTLVYTLATRPDKAGGQVKATASVGAGGVAGAVELSW
jgi:hypothetical protein